MLMYDYVIFFVLGRREVILDLVLSKQYMAIYCEKGD